MEQSTTASLTQNVDTLFTNLEKFTQNEGVIGKPVTFENKTFLPIVSVALGYGGGNSANKTHPEDTTSQPMGNMSAKMSGGALGLGAKLSTEAVIIIDKDKNDVSLIPINAATTSQLADKIPQMLMNMGQGVLGGQQSQGHEQQGNVKQGGTQGLTGQQGSTGAGRQ